MTMTHPLDPILARVYAQRPRFRLPLNLLDLTYMVSALQLSALGLPGGELPPPDESLRANQMGRRLVILTQYCCAWASVAGVVDPAEAMQEEYDRACLLHPGMTLDSDAPTDAQRLAALVEELGEVARALSYDAHTDRGHAGDLATELIQLGALAAAWATRYTTTAEEA